MERIAPPDPNWISLPCSICAVKTALDFWVPPKLKDDFKEINIPDGFVVKKDSYVTLNSMNKLIRSNLPVRKRVNFKKGERPLLKDYIPNNQETAIICCLGHYIYQEYDKYYSFYNNDNDEVVSVWILI